MKTNSAQAAAVPNTVACRFTGKSHVRSGKPCQDAYAVGKAKDGRIILALADGVSNSPNSEAAAQAAVQAAVEFWQEFDTGFPGEDAWRSAFRASMNYALRKAEEAGAGREEAYGYETTLIIALVQPGKEMVYSFVGDSGIWLQQDDGSIRLAEERMREEDGSVCTLSSGPEGWKYGKQNLEDCRAVLLATDGVSDTIREADEHYALAGSFLAGAATDEDYEKHCRAELEKDAFRDMEDDATFVLCRLKAGNGPVSPGKTEPAKPKEPAELKEPTKPKEPTEPAAAVRPWNEPEDHPKKKKNTGLIGKLLRSFFGD